MRCAKKPRFKSPSVLTYATTKKRGFDKADR